MLKTVDILIGAVTVILLFSMTVTVITQAITSLFQRQGRHLRDGLAALLAQLGVTNEQVAQTIATKILEHPLIASAEGKLGTVIHREEFTKLLLDFASGQGATTLDGGAKSVLLKTLENNGISKPEETLKNVRAMALQLEASNPQMANHVRDSLALLHEASSDFVARINSWFDQSMDRVSAGFTRYTHGLVVGVSALVVLAVQLDMIAVVNRLSIDDQFREFVVSEAAKDLSKQATVSDSADNKQSVATGASGSSGNDSSVQGSGVVAASPVSANAPQADASKKIAATNANEDSNVKPGNEGSGNKDGKLGKASVSPTVATNPNASSRDTKHYYDLLNNAGLLTLPFAAGWSEQFRDPRKWPGMIISILLLSLGAPFWYDRLKDLLKLRSVIAGKDDAQRGERQSAQGPTDTVAGGSSGAPLEWPKGESGDLRAVG